MYKCIVYSQIMLAMFLFACNQNSGEASVERKDSLKHAEQGIIDTSITEAVANTIQPNIEAFDEETRTVLQKFFSDSSIDELETCVFGFADVKTDAEFAELYKRTCLIREKISQEPSLLENYDGYWVSEELTKLDEKIPFIVATCVAECTEFDYTFNLKEFMDVAKETSGDADDKYFDVLIMACGDYGGQDYNWLNFFERTWDYGGGSLLGDSLCFNFLEKSWSAMQKSDLFKDDILIFRDRCIHDMEHPIYMYSQEKVLAEVKRILEAEILLPKEMERMQALEYRNSVELNKVQFDCLKGDCNFGG